MGCQQPQEDTGAPWSQFPHHRQPRNPCPLTLFPPTTPPIPRVPPVMADAGSEGATNGKPSLRICSRRRGAGSRRGAPNRIIRLGPAQPGRDARRLQHCAAKQSHLLQAGPARAGGCGGAARAQGSERGAMGGSVGALGRVTGATGVIHWSCPARALGCPGQTQWAKALSEMDSQQPRVLLEPPQGSLLLWGAEGEQG